MIEIGENVEITEGVRLLTHDGGVKVPMLMGLVENADLFGRIRIRNNVFIGMNAIVLPGIEFGNNVIVGAGSIVTRSIPDNSVVCGNPAHILCTVEEYCTRNQYRIYLTDDLNYVEKKKAIEHIVGFKL